MANWLEETKNQINNLKKEGFFDNWKIKKTEYIIFHIYPGLEIPKNWVQERVNIYAQNAKMFGINCPPCIDFYVYQSIDSAKNIGITPAISFLKQKEIHGHLKQSAGHELTHILLGDINPSENLPANGLWEEALCVYYDGTNTDRKKHTNSINYSEEILDTPWDSWRSTLPSNLYPLAGGIAQYCVEKYDLKLLLSFIKEMRNNGKNDENLCSIIFKISYHELQKNWKQWLKNKATA